MRSATASVGLVSPRSTWESIGAETPLRSARSRSDRSMPSRRARIRVPTPVTVDRHALYVITDICMFARPGPGRLPSACGSDDSPDRTERFARTPLNRPSESGTGGAAPARWRGRRRSRARCSGIRRCCTRSATTRPTCRSATGAGAACTCSCWWTPPRARSCATTTSSPSSSSSTTQTRSGAPTSSRTSATTRPTAARARGGRAPSRSSWRTRTGASCASASVGRGARRPRQAARGGAAGPARLPRLSAPGA